MTTINFNLFNLNFCLILISMILFGLSVEFQIYKRIKVNVQNFMKMFHKIFCLLILIYFRSTVKIYCQFFIIFL